MPDSAGSAAHPWQRTVRTAVQVGVSLAVAAPLIYSAATNSDPGAATGAAGVGLGIAAAVTRVMALPVVEQLLRRRAPWLSASDVSSQEVVARLDPSGSSRVVAGEASPQENGTPVSVVPSGADRGAAAGLTRC